MSQEGDVNQVRELASKRRTYSSESTASEVIRIIVGIDAGIVVCTVDAVGSLGGDERVRSDDGHIGALVKTSVGGTSDVGELEGNFVADGEAKGGKIGRLVALVTAAGDRDLVD